MQPKHCLASRSSCSRTDSMIVSLILCVGELYGDTVFHVLMCCALQQRWCQLIMRRTQAYPTWVPEACPRLKSR